MSLASIKVSPENWACYNRSNTWVGSKWKRGSGTVGTGSSSTLGSHVVGLSLLLFLKIVVVVIMAAVVMMVVVVVVVVVMVMVVVIVLGIA